MLGPCAETFAHTPFFFWGFPLLHAVGWNFHFSMAPKSATAPKSAMAPKSAKTDATALAQSAEHPLGAMELDEVRLRCLLDEAVSWHCWEMAVDERLP